MGFAVGLECFCAISCTARPQAVSRPPAAHAHAPLTTPPDLKRFRQNSFFVVDRERVVGRFCTPSFTRLANVALFRRASAAAGFELYFSTQQKLWFNNDQFCVAVFDSKESSILNLSEIIASGMRSSRWMRPCSGMSLNSVKACRADFANLAIVRSRLTLFWS